MAKSRERHRMLCACGTSIVPLVRSLGPGAGRLPPLHRPPTCHARGAHIPAAELPALCHMRASSAPPFHRHGPSRVGPWPRPRRDDDMWDAGWRRVGNGDVPTIDASPPRRGRRPSGASVPAGPTFPLGRRRLPLGSRVAARGRRSRARCGPCLTEFAPVWPHLGRNHLDSRPPRRGPTKPGAPLAGQRKLGGQLEHHNGTGRQLQLGGDGPGAWVVLDSESHGDGVRSSHCGRTAAGDTAFEAVTIPTPTQDGPDCPEGSGRWGKGVETKPCRRQS